MLHHLWLSGWHRACGGFIAVNLCPRPLAGFRLQFGGGFNVFLFVHHLLSSFTSGETVLPFATVTFP